jgi:transcriptional regulator with XRE-family HTH domain/ribosome-binding protein aMBF1 (putative translation factor)
MPRPESTDMANVSKRRPRTGPGSEAGNVPTSQTLSEVVRSAMTRSKLSYHQIALASGVYANHMSRFVRHKCDMRIKQVEMIFGGLGLKPVLQSKTGPDDPHQTDAPQTFSDAIRSAMTRSKLSYHEIARRSGVYFGIVGRFQRREGDIFVSTAEKLLEGIAQRVVLEPIARRPGPNPPVKDHPRPIADAIQSAIADRKLSIHSLGIEAGISHSIIRSFVRGDHDIKVKTAEKLVGPLAIEVILESKTGPDDPHQTLSEVIRSAIDGSGVTFHELAMKSGVHEYNIAKFQRREGDLTLKTAEKLFVILPLQVVQGAIAPRPERKPRHRIMDELLLAIKDSPISSNALAKRSGVSIQTVIKIRNGYDKLSPIISIKLANALGITLEPAELAMIQGLPDALTSSAAGPISAPRGSATIKGASIDQEATITQADPPTPFDRPREPSPWDDWDASVCPVQVREDGHLVVFGRVKRRLVSPVRIRMVSRIAARYPFGLGKIGLRDFGKGARQAFYELKRLDADCDAAFQPAVSKGGLFKFGRADS